MTTYGQQGNSQAYPMPPTSYPPPGQAYPEAAAPPPLGYPTNGTAAPQQVPVKTKSRGDGFWKGCCAALCCCCALETCF